MPKTPAKTPPKAPATTVLGHDIPKARLTPLAWCWIALYLGLPVLLIGSLLDALSGWWLQRCTAWWCLFF